MFMGQSLLLRPDGTVPVRGAAFKGFGLSGILHDHERSPWNSGFGKTHNYLWVEGRCWGVGATEMLGGVSLIQMGITGMLQSQVVQFVVWFCPSTP